MELSVQTAVAAIALFGKSLTFYSQAAPPLDSADARLWSEDLAYLSYEMPAQHANLFHTMRREQFDSALASIRERLPALSRAQVIVELERLAALVGDGHTNVSPWRDTVVAFHTLPITVYKFQGGYYVRAAAQPYASLLGARVVRIGGVPMDSAAALVAPLVGRDNAMGPWMYGPLLLVMPEVLQALGMSTDPMAAEWTFATGQGARTVTLRASAPFPNYSGDADKEWDSRPGWVDLRDKAPTPLWLSRTGDTYWFSWIPEGRILYCQLNEVQQRGGETIEGFFARALAAADSLGAERFVLDLRLNGGGNGYYNRAIVRALVRSRYDAPGRLFVITSRRTFSAAEMLIDALESWSNPIFVGEPAASRGNTYGDSKKLVTPNSKVTLRVSTLYWQFWDPRDTRPWIAPQIAADLTAEAYAAGRDPALEAIAHYVPQPPLTERLKPLLVAGDSAGAWQAIEAFKANPVNAWQVPADSLESVDQTLQAEGNKDAAALGERLRSRLPPPAYGR